MNHSISERWKIHISGETLEETQKALSGNSVEGIVSGRCRPWMVLDVEVDGVAESERYLSWWVGRVWQRNEKVEEGRRAWYGSGQRRLGTLAVEVPLVFLHPAGCGTYSIKRSQG